MQKKKKEKKKEESLAFYLVFVYAYINYRLISLDNVYYPPQTINPLHYIYLWIGWFLPSESAKIVESDVQYSVNELKISDFRMQQ